MGSKQRKRTERPRDLLTRRLRHPKIDGKPRKSPRVRRELDGEGAGVARVQLLAENGSGEKSSLPWEIAGERLNLCMAWIYEKGNRRKGREALLSLLPADCATPS